jgi:hypothetical protein
MDRNAAPAAWARAEASANCSACLAEDLDASNNWAAEVDGFNSGRRAVKTILAGMRY